MSPITMALATPPPSPPNNGLSATRCTWGASDTDLTVVRAAWRACPHQDKQYQHVPVVCNCSRLSCSTASPSLDTLWAPLERTALTTWQGFVKTLLSVLLFCCFFTLLFCWSWFVRSGTQTVLRLCLSFTRLPRSCLTCTCASLQQSEQSPKDMSHPCASIKDPARDNTAAFHSQRAKNEVWASNSCNQSNHMLPVIAVAAAFQSIWSLPVTPSVWTSKTFFYPSQNRWFMKWRWIKTISPETPGLILYGVFVSTFHRSPCITILTLKTAPPLVMAAWSSLSRCLAELAASTEVRSRWRRCVLFETLTSRTADSVAGGIRCLQDNL